MNNPTLIRLSLVKLRELLFGAAVLFHAASILAQTASAQNRDSGKDGYAACHQKGAPKIGYRFDSKG